MNEKTNKARATSGQNVPKSPKSKFRHKSQQEQTAASKLRMEKRGEKLEKAKEKLAKQKPPKPPGPVRRVAGTVGGGVCMNAGAYGGEMKQVLRSASVLFPEAGVRTLTCEELELGYRHSLLTEHPEAVVLGAEFALTPGDPAQIRETMRELMARRKASQPLEWPSAGSTFKRPEGHFAGTLIDQCGLKGLTVGGAQVSEKHAGFLINRGGATFADMTELIRQVQQRVLDAAGVRLEPEVKIVR